MALNNKDSAGKVARWFIELSSCIPGSGRAAAGLGGTRLGFFGGLGSLGEFLGERTRALTILQRDSPSEASRCKLVGRIEILSLLGQQH